MPVYNAEKTIVDAIESVRAQTFSDFDLVISDNASTDGTREILERFAREDPRISILSQARNIGANLNYSAVARAATGEYFKWASSNDWSAPTLLERCVAVLDARPDAVLAYPRSKLFSKVPSDGIEYHDGMDLQNESPAARFEQLVHRMRLNNAMNGVIRVEALRRTHLLATYYSADVVLMGHLALIGKFVEVEETLFFRRMDAATATALRTAEDVLKHHYPKRTVGSLFQNWRLYGGWMRAIMGTPLPVTERRRAITLAFRMIYWNRKELVADMGEALRYLTGKTAR
jgi:glycosyltransferase involved in cell wall biosynthesis